MYHAACKVEFSTIHTVVLTADVFQLLIKYIYIFLIKSSTEKQSSAIIVHKPKRTATSTRTIHTRQNKPCRLGAVRAGVLGARGRCCPAATVPVAVVVLPCGVRYCIYI